MSIFAIPFLTLIFVRLTFDVTQLLQDSLSSFDLSVLPYVLERLVHASTTVGLDFGKFVQMREKELVFILKKTVPRLPRG